MTRSRVPLVAFAVVCLLVPPAMALPPVVPDAVAGRKLQALEDYTQSEDWTAAAPLAQRLLDSPRDVFVRVTEKGQNGAPPERIIGVRLAVNRALARWPEKGREVYEKTYGAKAAALLARARKDSDKQQYADVAQRYLYTKAGPEAAERLATVLLEERDFAAAARAFDRLVRRAGVEKLEPLTLYNAARAFHQSGTAEDRDGREKVWKQLAVKTPKGLHIDGQDRSLKELEEDLKKLPPRKGPAPDDWPMFGGTPGRDGQGAGGPPFLQALWRQSLFVADKQTEKIIGDRTNGVVAHLEMKGEAVIPAAVPLAATLTTPGGKRVPVVVFRNYEGVQARELKTGAQTWGMAFPWSLEKMRGNGGSTAATLNQWVQYFNQANQSGVLIENSTIGTMSSDGGRVYCIDDLAVPPAHQQGQFDRWGGRLPPDTGGFPAAVNPGVTGNHLNAIAIASGKLAWSLPPSHSQDDEQRVAPKNDFRDSHFLGAPLPLDGKLYFLNEKNQEIRLVCLDTSKLPRRAQEKDVDDAIAWVQPLATAKEKLIADYRRRISATHIACGEGILVCPTNAGALCGVDLLTHSLVWAHAYGEDAAKVPAGRPRVRPFPVLSAGEWKAAAPVVQAGKVVFTSPDGPELRCLSLRDGRLLWGAKAGGDDVYFAGVFAGRVLVVSKRDVRALNLDDGKELWRLPTGLPSGRGAASDNVYYLPLKEAVFPGNEKGPGIFTIDVARGQIVARTRSKKGGDDVPGNLIFFDGKVVSQTATELVAYPLLKAKIGEMDELLKKDPNAPRGLLERGELRLEQGNALGAVEDFRGGLANKPDDDLRRALRARLYDALTDLLRRDFGAGEKFLKEYEELSREPVDPKTPPEARAEQEAERERRLVLLLSIKGRGCEAQGKAVEALNTYLELATLKGAGAWAATDDPARKARPDVWARGRIAALYAGAKAPARQRLEEEIGKKGASLRKGKDVEALRAFVSMFSPTLAAGREAHLALAERLMERGGKADLLDAEQLLLKLSARAEDRQTAGRAIEALARLLSRKGMLEDALAYYRILARDHATTVIRDGKKGAEYLDELKTDKRFLLYMDEPGDAQSNQKFKAVEERDKNFAQQAQHMLYTFDPLDDPLPFLKPRRVGVNYSNSHLMIVDRRSNKPELDEQLKENFSQFMNAQVVNSNFPPGMPGNPNPQATGRFGYHAVGHLVVVNLGQYIAAVDTIAHKLLWEKNLLGAASNVGGNSQLHYNPAEETLQLMFPDNTFMTVGQAGPVSASYVCLQTRDGLAALEPLTGQTLWTRNDVPARCRLFGDDRHIYLVETDNTGTATRTRAFRAEDGDSVAVPPFAPLFQKRLRVIGRELLVADKEPNGEVTLRLYDMHTGKDLWKQSFKAGSVILSSVDPELAGAIGPDGRITVVNLPQRKVVLVALVQAEHMKNLQQAHLLADGQSIYVAFHTSDPANPPQIWSNLQANTGLRGITVNGYFYAFDRRTCKIRWYNIIENQQLVLEQWKEMPVLLFTSRFNVNPKAMRGFNGGQFGVIGIEVYDKATGKMFYRQPTNGQPQLNPQSGQIYAVNYDADSGKIELIAQNYKVTLTRMAPAAP